MESINLPVAVEIPSEIKELSRQIEQWRSDPRRGRRMPESLWALAVRVAGQHGACRVSRCLRLDYYSLKERMRHGAEGIDTQPKPTFIELSTLSSAAVPECSIELENPRGFRMRIHVKGTGLPDLVLITRAFCGAKR